MLVVHRLHTGMYVVILSETLTCPFVTQGRRVLSYITLSSNNGLRRVLFFFYGLSCSRRGVI